MSKNNRMISKEEITNKLNEALKLYNQKELAKMLGVSEPYLSRLKNPTKAVERFINLMDLINLEIKDFRK